MKYIPSLEANYTPIPQSFLQLVLAGRLGRECTVVLLYFFSKTYGWKQEKGFVTVSDLVASTHLDEAEVLQGVREGISLDQLIEMPLDPSNPEESSVYLLNTVENRRFLDLYANASTESPSPVADSSPGEAPANPSSSPSSLPSAPSPASSPPEKAKRAKPPKAAPAKKKASPSPAEKKPDPNKPYLDYGYTQKTVEMIIRILGRVPTRDEKVRLKDLDASDADLIEAMGRLIEKKVQVYSSDLIVYEFEALQSARRRQSKEVERKSALKERQEKTRSCAHCDGLGYVFVGVGGVQECECRK